MITQKQQKEAEKLYQNMFRCLPAVDGYKYVDIYEKQSAYLYGKSSEAIEAYKTCQNIIRFMLTGFMWPLVVDIIILFWGMFKGIHPEGIIINWQLVSGTLFFIGYFIYFLILWHKCSVAEKKVNGNLVWINY